MAGYSSSRAVSTRTSELGDLLASLRAWQDDRSPFQLHPGDVGWHWRFGADATAAALRSWSLGGETLAIGLRDGPTLRMAIAPAAARDDSLAHSVVNDILAGDAPSVEVPLGTRIRELLAEAGWTTGEQWTPLSRELSDPVEAPRVEIEVTSHETVDSRVTVHRGAFENSTFTSELWHRMAAGPEYSSARCLVARDRGGTAVAAATVWSAGEGRPGLIEPLGVHRDERGRGYGTAMTLAAAAALREMGASSVLVCTPAANVAAVATYASAGLVPRATTADLERPDSTKGPTP